MNRTWALIGLLAVSAARADEPVLLPAVALPPAAAEPAAILDGTTVSRPLRPVSAQEPAPATLPAPTTAVEAEFDSSITLPRTWSRYDLLMWFPKAQPNPPLLTLGPPVGFPALGQPGTTVLIGNGSIDTPMSTGGRFTYGWAGNNDRDVGLELSYFFTGTRSARAAADGFARPITLARPVIDSSTGGETAVFVSSPGVPGAFAATADNRMTGWEANVVGNLYRSESARVTLLAGYCYFLNHEGLHLRQMTAYPGGLVVNSVDQFDGHTRFHGGQLGFEASGDWQKLYAEVVGKVAIGRSFQVVKAQGQTTLSGLGAGTGVTNAGVLATGTNSGRTANAAFAVLPEFQFNLGYKISDRQRFSIGYNAIYLSEAVRPGDQIDRALPTVVAANAIGAPALRPAPVFKSTDFWVQGITMGFVHKY